MRILVVEDDELTIRALSTVLTQQNHAVETARDGETGWELIDSYEFDLVLLDVMLPRLNGLDLCRRLRAQGKQMPILLLTGRDSGHDKAIGLDAGADDYIVKPFDPEELVARIRALLRRSNVGAQPILEWGQLRLDPSTCQVSYHTTLLSTTPKEYALLELFLRNNRRVFSCGAILEHLWAFEDAPGEEAVRTHIKGLRQKLKAAGAAADLVETVYGIGYRLKPLEESSNLAKSKKPTRAQTATSTTASLAPDSTQQKTLAAIASIWERFKPRVNDQIAILEQAALALASNHLDPTLQQQAKQEAHTLAGSLGTFGFPAGSSQAREIEHLLQRDRLKKPEIQQLQTLVANLRQELDLTQTEPVLVSGPTCTIAGIALPYTVKIMAVDDDPALLEILHTLLEPWGFQVTTLNDPRQFWPTLETTPPDLLILDLQMPYHDGFELCQAIRESETWGGLPVMVLTAHTDAPTVNRVFEVGADDFISKPIVGPELVTRIINRMERVKLRHRLQATPSNSPTVATEQLFNQSPDPLGILDRAGGFKQVNPAFSQILGYTPAELLTLPWLELVHPDDRPLATGELENLSPDQPTLSLEIRHRCKDDLYRWLAWRGRLVTEENLIYVVAHDVTERKRQEAIWLKTRDATELRVAERTAELVSVNQRLQRELDAARRLQEERDRANAALRISQARFAGILEIADDAIISIDTKQRITLFNLGAEKIFGYTANEVLGRTLDILLPPSAVMAHRRHVKDFGTSSGQARRMGERRPIYGRRKDGSEFPAEASISRLELGDEMVFTVILRDITERKNVERMKDEFVSVVSHELRTPLTSIHGSLGMLASGLLSADSERGKRLLQIAVDSTDRLVRLINDILDIERIESGKVNMVKTTCNVVDLLAEAVDGVQAIADRADITLEVETLSAQIWVDGDRIVQTLTNLLSNAIKFSPAGNKIWLSATLCEKPGDRQQTPDPSTRELSYPPPSSEILFVVRDWGRGIPADKLETIFERFQQADASDSRNHDGTGLGLAICRSIVQQHGGHIWVESELGAGSSFYFTLPVG